MEFTEVLLIIGMLLIIWGGGYLAGRFGKAWKIAEQPVIGTIVLEGDDMYLHMLNENYRDTLEANKRVTVMVSKLDISESREKPSV